MKQKQWSLFSRLLLYFSIVMLIPTIILMGYYYIGGQRSLHSSLEEQSAELLQQDGMFISSVVGDYRHKIYEISTNQAVVDLLQSGSGSNVSQKDIYTYLFTIMAGDTYKASASIISEDGQTRLSTHIFPDEYDLRIHGNEWQSGSILTEARTRKYDQRSTLVYGGDHRMTDEKQQVFVSLLRCVFTPGGEIAGYVIIDIFTSAVIPYLTGSSIFMEEILLDDTNYTAFSLVHPNLSGPLDRFPSITAEGAMTSRYKLNGFTLIGVTDTSVFHSSAENLLFGVAVAMVIGFMVAVGFALLFSHSMSKRIGKMKSTMKYIEEGNLNLYLEETGVSDFNELATSFNSMVTRMIALLQAQGEEKARTAEAERKALESQLDPHFIFNTLSTIKALAKLHGEDEIYTIALQLGKLLRSSLRNRSPECTLEESCALAESYLQIQKIRFGEKLDYSIEITEAAKGIMTPKLIIQPLAENALVHGIEPTGEAGRIDIRVYIEDDYAIIKVKDTGCGCDEAMFSDLDTLSEAGHVGIANIANRLRLKYGGRYAFKVKSVKGEGTTVTIVVPAKQ